MGGGRTGSTNGVDAGAANEGEGVGVEVAPPFSFLFSLYRVVYSVLFRWILLLLLHAEKDSSLKNQKKNSVKPGKTQPTRSGLCWAIGNPSMARVGFDANPVKPGKTQRTHVLLSLSLSLSSKRQSINAKEGGAGQNGTDRQSIITEKIRNRTQSKVQSNAKKSKRPTDPSKMRSIRFEMCFFFFAFYFGVPERKTVAIEKSLDDPPPPPPSDPPPTPLPTLRRHPQPTPWY